MKWFEGFTLRSFLFGVGAIGAVAEAIDIALRSDIQLTPAHLIAVSCVAVTAYAMRWPSDVTKTEAKEREQRARRESMLPPPDPNELIDIPGPHIAPRKKRP